MQALQAISLTCMNYVRMASAGCSFFTGIGHEMLHARLCMGYWPAVVLTALPKPVLTRGDILLAWLQLP